MIPKLRIQSNCQLKFKELIMSTFSSESADLAKIIASNGSNWSAISAESAARMRIQNKFQTGLDIARYTAGVMRQDMEAYDLDPSAYTQSLGCWHGFIGQQKLISIKKHFGSTKRKYLYLSGWMVAALRSEFGPLPDQSMHEKTSVASLIGELYTFLRQADARVLGGLFRHCLLYTSPSPRDRTRSRMPSSA